MVIVIVSRNVSFRFVESHSPLDVLAPYGNVTYSCSLHGDQVQWHLRVFVALRFCNVVLNCKDFKLHLLCPRSPILPTHFGFVWISCTRRCIALVDLSKQLTLSIRLLFVLSSKLVKLVVVQLLMNSLQKKTQELSMELELELLSEVERIVAKLVVVLGQLH